MPSRRRALVGALCTLLVTTSMASQPQVRRGLGSVRTADDQPVSRADVDIDGVALGVASGKGVFNFDVPPFKVGFPYTFHVAGWVILDPCVLARGRLYLPDPDAERIALKVVRPRDSRLLSPQSVGCLVEEKASRFEPKRVEPKRDHGGLGPRSGLLNARPPIFAQAAMPSLSWRAVASEARLVRPAYNPDPVADRAPFQQQSQDGQGRIGDESQGRQAEDLGFTPEQLRSAIDRWRETATGQYQKGLAAFSAGHYAEARDYISKSIESGTSPVERYVPLGRVEYELGHYSAAESALRRVLAVHKDDPLILNDLGVVLNAEARFAEAEPLLNRALAIDEKALGSEHPHVARDLNSLAGLYEGEARDPTADPLLKRALAIDEKALGPEHPDVARDLNDLALLYDREGKHAEAEGFLKRALAIDEKVLGPEHPDLGTIVSNLAFHYDTQDRGVPFWEVKHEQHDTESLYKRALAIHEKAFGEEHPVVAIDLANLASFYSSRNKYDEAEPLIRQALAIGEKTLGPDHPMVAELLGNLAQLYFLQGRRADAEALYQRDLTILEKAFGPEDTRVADLLDVLATFYDIEGGYAEAESLKKQSVAIDEKARGDYAQAESLEKRALAINEKALGPDDLATAKNLNNLAWLECEHDKCAEAEPLYKRALTIEEKRLGPDNPDVATIDENLAELLRKLGHERKAKIYEHRAAKIRAK